MFKSSAPPIHIHVTEDHWYSYGRPNSLEDAWKFQILKREGGIAASVPPGWYDYNVIRKGLRFTTSLKRHK